MSSLDLPRLRARRAVLCKLCEGMKELMEGVPCTACHGTGATWEDEK
jgi:DnaJ-class molecular chaperone